MCPFIEDWTEKMQYTCPRHFPPNMKNEVNIIFRKMAVTGDNYSKQSKSVSEKQLPGVLSSVALSEEKGRI